jgi:autotransporter-associated beta strand protein
MRRDWLPRLWKELFGDKNRSKPVRCKPRSLRLGMEILEDRLALTGNIAITNALVVDKNNNPLHVVNAGEWVYIQADFTTQGLPSNASYRVSFTVNGLTIYSSYITWGAGNSGTGYWDLYWGTVLATPGTNQVTATVDPDHSVAETSYADNTTSFTFNAVAPQVPGSNLSYTVAQIRAAYGIDSIPKFGSATADGSGQTIALDEAGNEPSILTDLDGFDKAMTLTTGPTPMLYQQYGPASSFVTVYNQSGTNITADIATSGSNGVPAEDPTGHWEGEETLDVEWAHAIAPGAKIDIIEVNDDANWPTNLLAGDALAAHLPGVSAVSNSWGLDEWSSETAYDSSTLVTPSGHTGVTFLTASNDNGASVYPSPPSNPAPSVGNDGYYPATSPNVLSVGGTELTVNNNVYGSETGWSFPAPTSTIDNGSPSYTQSGLWASQSGGFSGAYSIAAGGGSSSAAWTVSITPTNTGWGTEVSATWTANPSNATDATYTIYDGSQTSGTILGKVVVDQTKTPVGTVDGSSQFQELGVFFPTLTTSGTGTLTVVLDAKSANGIVVADAIGSAQAWASTGGPTRFESEPSYQLPFQSTGYRTSPDVSFDASQNTGVTTYFKGNLNYGSFGTSLSSPCWAGLIAIANQGLVADGGTTLNSTANPQQTLQALYGLPASDFYDITSGYNGYTAGPGYDEVTGRGSPIANILIPDLVSYVPLSVSQSSVSVTPTSIQSGNTATVTLTAKDTNGKQETSGGLTVVFGLGAGSSDGTFSGVTDNGNVTYTATFTGTTAGTPRTITATIDGRTVTSALPTVTVATGPVNGVWAASGGGAFNWSTDANWQGGAVPGVAGDTAVFGAAVGSGTATITLDASRALSSLTFNPAAGGSYVLSGSGSNSLQLANSGGSASISVTSGSNAIKAPVMLGDNVKVAAAGGTSLTISDPISESGGSHAVTLSGSGSLVLSGSNSYTGGTTVDGGTLILTNPSAIAANTSLTIGAGGILIFDPSYVAAPIEATNNLTDSVLARGLGTSAANRVVWSAMRSPPAPLRIGEGRYVRDLAWLGQSANSSDNSDEQRKKDATIRALDAVLAQYGQ